MDSIKHRSGRADQRHRPRISELRHQILQIEMKDAGRPTTRVLERGCMNDESARTEARRTILRHRNVVRDGVDRGRLTLRRGWRNRSFNGGVLRKDQDWSAFCDHPRVHIERPRHQCIVAVEKYDVFTRCSGGAVITSCNRPSVARKLDETNAAAVRREDVNRSVSRSIVHYDDFSVRKPLRNRGLDCVPYEIGLVVTGDDDAEAHRMNSRLALSWRLNEWTRDACYRPASQPVSRRR